jgi:hypothetical protein
MISLLALMFFCGLIVLAFGALMYLFYRTSFNGYYMIYFTVMAFVERYQKIYPTAVVFFQRDLEACLTVSIAQ